MKIGAFTIGGGYAMIPLIKNELDKRKWIGEDELPDIIALAQSAPGILAVNVSIFAGYKIKGLKGSITATLGSILPSFLIILAIAMAFTNFKDNPTVISIFKRIRPVHYRSEPSGRVIPVGITYIYNIDSPGPVGCRNKT